MSRVLTISGLRHGAKAVPLVLALAVGCASAPAARAPEQNKYVIHGSSALLTRGPWPKVSAVEVPTGDMSIPADLIRDVAKALLELPGARACHPETKAPIPGVAKRYYATVYLAGEGDDLSWRVSRPVRGDHTVCTPGYQVQDDDYPGSSQVWVAAHVHTHPCGLGPRWVPNTAWLLGAAAPFKRGMVEVTLVMAAPPYPHAEVHLASGMVVERENGTRVMLRYFAMGGELQQWSRFENRWVTLGTCFPSPDPFLMTVPHCNPLALLRE
ncbi:hypothetical protein ACLESO_04280 [Pyxidicoccus sp. 3LG]